MIGRISIWCNPLPNRVRADAGWEQNLPPGMKCAQMILAIPIPIVVDV